MTTRRLLVALSSIAGLVPLLGCGATTYDDSRIAPTSTAAEVVTIPVGPVSELLPRLVAEMAALSSRIGPRPDNVEQPESSKLQQLDLIEKIWNSIADEVSANDEAAAESLGRMVAQARTAVERNRPADADKAAKFARIVVDEYLADA